MDLNDLAKMDLKNIDLAKSLARLSAHADALLRLGVVVLTVLGGLKIIDDYLHQTKMFSAQIEEREEKFLQVMAYEKSINNLKVFWEKVPKHLGNDALVNFITDLAAKDNLEVLSFSPGQGSGDKLYGMEKVKFKLKVRQYKDLALFIHNLENSGYALRVESIYCSLEQGSADTGYVSSINVQMEIASIKINEDKNI